MPFRQRFADAVAISVNQIELEVRAGSTIVEMKIATLSGSDAAANTLNTKIMTTLADPDQAAATLGVPVLSLASGVQAASPASPPLGPQPRPPPPSPPPAKAEDNTPLVAIVIASISGALVLAVVAFVCFFMPRNNQRAPVRMNPIPPAVVVYAESAFQAKGYSKL